MISLGGSDQYKRYYWAQTITVTTVQKEDLAKKNGKGEKE